MYEYISGKIIERTPTYVIVENNGIGYFINISLHTFDKIKSLETAKFFLHFIVREDAHIFYGFYDDNERILFRALISVSGVGANTARLVLSALSPKDAYQAIASADVVKLTSVKGIGGKTAQRIVVDLKDKLIKKGFVTENMESSHNTIKEEALSGLQILGFNKIAASRVLDKILKSGNVDTVEGLIKEALKIL